jgi:two-component system chemotaxis response regulator CheB
MSGRRIVVVGASAGGVEGLMALARSLPADLPAAVFMVLHIPAHATSVLPQLLNRQQRLTASHAVDGEVLRHGHIYVAPADHHLLVHGDRVRLGRGPNENGHRPAIDPLFRSVAHWHGPRVVGVVLSGSLDDGTAGLLAIKMAGGITVVQEPADALYPSMPQSALDNVDIDHVAPLANMGDLITKLVHEPVSIESPAATPRLQAVYQEAFLAEEGPSAVSELVNRGAPSVFACPDCHGVLWEVSEGDLVRYRCRVGHAYLPQSLSAAMAGRVEEALWLALRALRESSALSLRMAERAARRNMASLASAYETRKRDADTRAKVLEEVLKAGHLNAEFPTHSSGTGE